MEKISVYMMKIQMDFAVMLHSYGVAKSAHVQIHTPRMLSSYGLAFPHLVLVLSINQPANKSVTPSKTLLASSMVPTSAAGIPRVSVQYIDRYPIIIVTAPNEIGLVCHASSLPNGTLSALSAFFLLIICIPPVY